MIENTKVTKMMQNEDYNGWQNRETWAVMLHLDNDQNLQQDYMQLYKMVKSEDLTSDVLTPDQKLIYNFSDQLKEWVSDIVNPNYWQEHGIDMPEWAIYMNEDVGSLWRVYWDQIARRIHRDMVAEEDYVNSKL